jgi:hypothetical protein
MGWFKKKEEVIDLTKLRDKGVMQRSLEIARRREGDNSSEDTVDLTNSTMQKGSKGLNNSNGSLGESAMGNDFLSALAGAGSNIGEGGENPESLDVVSNLKEVRKSRSKDFNELKNKIEDIDYKLNSFIERLDKLEEKFGI